MLLRNSSSVKCLTALYFEGAYVTCERRDWLLILAVEGQGVQDINIANMMSFHCLNVLLTKIAIINFYALIFHKKPLIDPYVGTLPSDLN